LVSSSSSVEHGVQRMMSFRVTCCQVTVYIPQHNTAKRSLFSPSLSYCTQFSRNRTTQHTTVRQLTLQSARFPTDMYNGYSLASVSSKCQFSDLNQRPSNVTGLARRFHQPRTVLQQQTATAAISKTAVSSTYRPQSAAHSSATLTNHVSVNTMLSLCIHCYSL
jgi:hypothetical protein